MPCPQYRTRLTCSGEPLLGSRRSETVLRGLVAVHDAIEDATYLGHFNNIKEEVLDLAIICKGYCEGDEGPFVGGGPCICSNAQSADKGLWEPQVSHMTAPGSHRVIPSKQISRKGSKLPQVGYGNGRKDSLATTTLLSVAPS